MTHLAFPFDVDHDGHAALAGRDRHARDLIEQVLFTNPGERVNQPEFGAGLLALVFSGVADETTHAVRAVVVAALQRWLGDVIEVVGVDVATDDSALTVSVDYVLRRSGMHRSDRFEMAG